VERSQESRRNWERRRAAIIRARARDDDVESLWKAVSRNQRELLNQSQRPVLQSLEESWMALDALYGGIVKRGNDQRTATTPFEAVMFHIEMGFYPPPELLLALSDAYALYRHAAGKLSLEEVFFGRPRRKAGNHAKRRTQHAKLLWMSIQMHFLLKEGYTKIRAAEEISNRLGGKPEPESIIRMLNADRFARSITGQ
jgi:hypothetical protein